MNILHYTLGLPPYARGGLTKYAIDLIISQKQLGNEVSVLWPGRFAINGKQKIRYSIINGIDNYEIVNPLPLPQIYGIREFDNYTKAGDKEVYKELLSEIKPQILHLHTLMGLHKELLFAAKELNVKIVYTSHDFFGICPKSTLFYNGKSCSENHDNVGCWDCCQFALSMNKSVFLQSSLYRTLKESILFKKLRAAQKSKGLAVVGSNVDSKIEMSYRPKFTELRAFYFDIFAKIEVIHFNSSLTRDVYFNFIKPQNSVVINITHAGIKNNWIEKIKVDKIKFTYVGAIAEFKGFYLFLNVLDRIYKTGFRNFEVNVYGDVHDIDKPYLKLNKPYKYDELISVVKETDVMVAPRGETFGFTVLEFLSNGCPVLVGEGVGAKDLIVDNVTGWIVNYNEDAFYDCIVKILKNPEIVNCMNNEIKNQFKAKTIEKHNMEIMKLIYE